MVGKHKIKWNFQTAFDDKQMMTTNIGNGVRRSNIQLDQCFIHLSWVSAEMEAEYHHSK